MMVAARTPGHDEQCDHERCEHGERGRPPARSGIGRGPHGAPGGGQARVLEPHLALERLEPAALAVVEHTYLQGE
jgi:hypothetical protein